MYCGKYGMTPPKMMLVEASAEITLVNVRFVKSKLNKSLKLLV